MNILNKLKQINIFTILVILVITFALSLVNNYLSKKPIELIYKPKKVIEDSLLFGNLENKITNEIIDSNIKTNSENIKIELNNTNSNNSDIEKNNEFNKQQQVLKNEIKKGQITNNEIENYGKENTLENLEKVVNYNQVLKIIKNNNFLIIDARSIDDYQKGKIGNAINIFPYNENENEYFQQIMSLPRDKRFLIYCTGGNCDLSHHLAKDMSNFGYVNIFIYEGGWEDWEKKSQKK